ncbi:MJ0570-related uncharacterized domain-containing protein [Pseudozobellia thermophila]|uniref:MJ0570-related uncharacterized domain-containing protein n=2 Tax=Pseudozobellia thermophila TaxID=192903 RepID=A0A1M6G6E5_9FLAO|nr:MJ0570-related uncharacterized domain-containing protein [Pseudozobellia thermophila]
MAQRKKAVFNWSGGKDSALALLTILQEAEFEVVSLLTTIDEKTATSSIHDIPLNLLRQQADSIGIPLYPVTLSKEKSYTEGMTEAATHFKDQGVKHFIFGDIFLSDVRAYREKILHPLGITLVEPLWGKTSKQVMADFLQSGIKTKIILTQADQLDENFIGREIDGDFARSLPSGVDLCGEKGEYHTFSYDGGPFKNRIDFTITKVNLISHEFKLDDGSVKHHEYWQAVISG